ncbi:basic proline-rich protein-like [Talpa occidentalis]|uniref:basic proline-rich protein-like n=1 Tax=Talpa occidentalis TaxID=50954 RepID=UPI0023F8ED95|nr:basic proline-rich protein-like [Talpa occidentalis]
MAATWGAGGAPSAAHRAPRAGPPQGRARRLSRRPPRRPPAVPGGRGPAGSLRPARLRGPRAPAGLAAAAPGEVRARALRAGGPRAFATGTTLPAPGTRPSARAGPGNGRSAPSPRRTGLCPSLKGADGGRCWAEESGHCGAELPRGLFVPPAAPTPPRRPAAAQPQRKAAPCCPAGAQALPGHLRPRSPFPTTGEPPPGPPGLPSKSKVALQPPQRRASSLFGIFQDKSGRAVGKEGVIVPRGREQHPLPRPRLPRLPVRSALPRWLIPFICALSPPRLYEENQLWPEPVEAGAGEKMKFFSKTYKIRHDLACGLPALSKQSPELPSQRSPPPTPLRLLSFFAEIPSPTPTQAVPLDSAQQPPNWAHT